MNTSSHQRRIAETDARFWNRVDIQQEGCWMWKSSKSPSSYGKTKPNNLTKQIGAHRFAYAWAYGLIPEGLVIDHLCNNPSCVRPSHLRAVTQEQNLLRSSSLTTINLKKTHCTHGHEFTSENTYLYQHNGKTHRACEMCRTERSKKQDETFRNDRSEEAMEKRRRRSENQGVVVRERRKSSAGDALRAYQREYQKAWRLAKKQKMQEQEGV